MGKFYMTDNKEWNNEFALSLSTAGFVESGLVDDAYFLHTYKKLLVDNQNFYNNKENNDFIACNGTLVYNSLTGIEALKQLLLDFGEKSITDIRKNLMGNYAIICRVNNITRIIVDETGTYALYYYIGTCFLISNTYYHVQKYAKQSLNEYAYLEQVLSPGIFNNETPFHNIYRLAGDECIYIGEQGIEIKKLELNEYKLGSMSFENTTEIISDALIKYAKQRSAISSSPILFLTGGVDSRLMLSVYSAIGSLPFLGNWQGCSFDMNTYAEDEYIAKQIAKKCNLELLRYDITHDICEDIRNLDFDNFEKYGEYAVIYGNNQKWFEIFENGGFRHWELGHLGEEFRNLELLDTEYHRNFTLKDYCYKIRFVEHDKYNFFAHKEFTVDGMQEYIYQKIRQYAVAADMDICNLSKSDVHKVYNISMLHSDTIKGNFYNMLGFYTNLYSQKEVFDYSIQVPYEYKINKKLILNMIQKLAPSLNEIPYFTRCHYMNFDQKIYQLVEIPTISYRASTIKHKVKNTMEKTRIGELLLSLYRQNKPANHIKANREIIKTYIEEISKYKVMDMLGITLNDRAFNYFPNYGSMLCHGAYMEKLL